MTLEAVVVCLDNSEWSRNGDYSPTRYEAQQDAAQLICGAKQNDNPENAVGIITMAGERVDVRVAPTQDIGKVLQALHQVPIGGVCDYVRSLRTAQLALKHRLNKNQKQRIVLFVGSPIASTGQQMELLGKTLKKNGVALDIISYGSIDINAEKIKKLHDSVNANGTSHLLEVVPDAGLLTEVVMSSAIFVEPSSAQAHAAASGTAGEGGLEAFGVDPNLDPELYLALRMSMEEERSRMQQRQEEEKQKAQGEPQEAPAEAATAARPPTVDDIADMEDIDDELRKALLMSLTDFQEEGAGGQTKETDTAMSALDPSLNANGLLSELSSLPGVDVSDPKLRDALMATACEDEEESKEETPPDGPSDDKPEG